MTYVDKYPTLLAALFLAVGLVACGGDAESAGDLESTPYSDDTRYGDVEAAADPPATVDEPAAAPQPASQPRTATSPPATTPPPVTAPSDPPPHPVASEPVGDPMPAGPTLPAGTEVTGVLETGLSTRTSRVDDVFHARIEEDLRAPDGAIVIPAGARLEGRVVESKESPSADEEAVLLLEITALNLNGERVPIHATVVGTEVAAGTRDSAQRQAATVATGAAAGAVVGRILGRDTRSTVTGAAVGAVAGAGIALTTRGGHATLEEGARITVRLESAMVVAGT